MRPLGFIESYEEFRKKIDSVPQKEKAFGFLLDSPELLLESSGLTVCERSFRELNELMTDRMSIYYLSSLLRSKYKNNPRRKSELVREFNEKVVSNLDIPHRVEYPCLLLFRPKGDNLTDRKYWYFGGDSCFYFGDLFEVISDYAAALDEASPPRSSLRHRIRDGYQSIKGELPKVLIAQTLESVLLSVVGLK
jgi:hypothetical protein